MIEAAPRVLPTAHLVAGRAGGRCCCCCCCDGRACEFVMGGAGGGASGAGAGSHRGGLGGQAHRITAQHEIGSTERRTHITQINGGRKKGRGSQKETCC